MLQVLFVFFIYISIPLLAKGIRTIRKIPLTLLYLLEIIISINLWTFVVVPFIYFDQKFSTAVCTYLVLFLVIYLVLLILGYKNRDEIKDSIQLERNFLKNNKLQFIMIIIIGYQVFRCAFFQTIAYSDSKTYIALINDIVETNRFYLLNDLDGSILSDISAVSYKYSLSSWFSFEAAISYVVGIHPLIVVNTILPPLIMIHSYIALWFLSYIFFKDQINKRTSFLIAVALLYQFQNDDPAMYFMIWPTWGKSIVMSMILPLLIYLYYAKDLEKRFSQCMILMASFAACFISTMGVVIVSIIYVIITIIEIIDKRKIDIRNLLMAIPFVIPVIVYACLYEIW